jgi:hypothetical protein
VDAVGADDQVGLDRRLAAGGIREPRALGRSAMRDALEPLPEPDRTRPQAVLDLAREQQLELAPVHRQLRPPVSGVEAAALAPDGLAEPVGVRQAAGRHADRRDPFTQSQLGELAHGVRKQVDADTQGLQLPSALVHDHVAEPRSVQAERGGETADAGSDDDDLHTASSHVVEKQFLLQNYLPVKASTIGRCSSSP